MGKLVEVAELVTAVEPSLSTAVKSFGNADGTVDGELRIDQLPPEMRTEEGLPSIVAMLSEALRAFSPFAAEPSMGGKFWASFGMRFGPQNEMEVGQLADLYKRFRGLFQTGTYPTPAWVATQIQLGLAPGLLTILQGVARNQGVPPSVILVRFVWTPDGKRPGHWEGEGGGGR